MIIDIHAYCGNWPYWQLRVDTSSDLVRLLDQFGIAKAVVTSTTGVFVAPADGNQHTADTIATHPDRLLGFATVCPWDEDAPEQLQRAADLGMRGLRLFPQHHGYRFDDDPVLAGILAVAEKCRLPILIPARIMANWSMPTLDVRQIGDLASRYPKLQFVIGGVNYGEVRDALSVMRRCPNVGLETSCLQIHNGVKLFVERAGAERIYFGSGLPLQYPGAGLAKIQHAQISDAAKDMILGGNAARLLSL